MVAPAAIFTASEQGVFEHAERVHPIYFEYLHEKVEDMTIDLPAGWQVSSVPPPQDQKMKVVAYSLKVEKGQGTLRLTRKLIIDIVMLEQKYYAANANVLSGGEDRRCGTGRACSQGKSMRVTKGVSGPHRVGGFVLDFDIGSRNRATGCGGRCSAVDARTSGCDITYI